MRDVGVLFVLLLVLCLTVYFVFPENPTNVPRSRPDGWNVLLIQADTLRADHLGCYGHARAKTPNIDALAAKGVLFEQHYVNATYTSCSVPSLLTGNYQDRHGLWFQGDIVSPDNYFLPEYMLEQGYYTMGLSSNPAVHPDLGYTQGIETMRNVDSTERADVMVDYTIDWLDENGDNPFFIWLLLVDPHFPYLPPADYASLYPESGDQEKSLSWQWIHNQDELDWDMESLLWGDLATPQSIAQETALYDGDIAYMDVQIGRLLDYLDEKGMRDNTLIVFTSDHGEEFAEHTFFCSHGHSTYDPVSRVPLIIQAPNMPPTRISQVVRTVDIMPTILSLLDIPYEEGLDGRSLEPLIRGTETHLPPVPAYITNGPIHQGYFKERPRMYVDGVEGAWRTVRTEDWKLIRIPHPEKDIIELYNMNTDPEEQHNLEQTHPEEVESLLTILDDIEKRVPADSLIIPVQPEIDEETKEMLESIGYITQ